MNIIARYRKIPLLTKLAFAMVLGVSAGLIFGESMTVVKPFGNLFLDLLKMACIPLVLTNLIAGISSLDNPKILGRIGIKIVGLFFGLTIIGCIWGIVFGHVFKPGDGITLVDTFNAANAEMPSALNTILGMIPSNIFASLSSGRLDQVVVFSAFAGLAVLLCKKADKDALSKGANIIANLFSKLVGIVMGYAPIGVFCLISSVIGVYGKAALGPAFKLVIALYLAFICQFIIFMLIVFIVTKQSPFKFVKKTMTLIVTALSTQSSLATLPVTMQTAEELGVRKSTYSFTIPLGAQICKDGHAIVLTLSLLFAAQTIGLDLTLPHLIQAILISLLLTTGSGGIPGGGLVTVTIMLTAFNMPTEAVAFIAGIFFIIDAGNTVINTYGDLLGTYIVDFSEKKKELHNHNKTLSNNIEI